MGILLGLTGRHSESAMAQVQYLQIIKVNEIREGVGKQSGQPYRMQDCECILLTDAGDVEEVGVLMLGKDQVGTTVPGTYAGSFSLRADKSKDGQGVCRVSFTGALAGVPSSSPGRSFA